MELFKIISIILTIASAILAIWISNVYLKESNSELLDTELNIDNIEGYEDDQLIDENTLGVWLQNPYLNMSVWYPLDDETIAQYGKKFNLTKGPYQLPKGSGESTTSGSDDGGGSGGSGKRQDSPRDKYKRYRCPVLEFTRKHVCTYCDDAASAGAFSERRVSQISYSQVFKINIYTLKFKKCAIN